LTLTLTLIVRLGLPCEKYAKFKKNRISVKIDNKERVVIKQDNKGSLTANAKSHV